ncbi:MAG: M15 family metallopeptidase [Patescibacteria group bacterium]
MAIEFKPSIDIPGSEFTKEVTVDGGTLARYIVGIYRYGGMFAGVVAMFMLVYAGWEWLLAGGNSSKISSARDKINGTLIGLALLFGGYILLSLISENLVKFKPLNTALPDVKAICMAFSKPDECTKARCFWIPATAEELAKDPKVLGFCKDALSLASTACPSESLVKPIQVSGIILSSECTDCRLTGPTISALGSAVIFLNAYPGHSLQINSAYRTTALQKELYDCYINKDGNTCPTGCRSCNEAAKPGCDAPHQTGTAVDICIKNSTVDTCGYINKAYNCAMDNHSNPAPCAGVPGLYDAQWVLLQTMRSAGFKQLDTEWWHFQLN